MALIETKIQVLDDKNNNDINEFKNNILTYNIINDGFFLVEISNDYKMYQKFEDIGYGQYKYYIIGKEYSVKNRIEAEYRKYSPAGYGTTFSSTSRSVKEDDIIIYTGWRSASYD